MASAPAPSAKRRPSPADRNNQAEYTDPQSDHSRIRIVRSSKAIRFIDAIYQGDDPLKYQRRPNGQQKYAQATRRSPIATIGARRFGWHVIEWLRILFAHTTAGSFASPRFFP